MSKRELSSKRITPPKDVVPELDWSFLEAKLPPIIWRHQWATYARTLGLPLSRGTMQNLDAARKGPERVQHCGRIGYRREALVEWLNGRAESKTSAQEQSVAAK